MNRLVWKLLRRHISGAQLAGFFLASLFGMSIVLLGIQFYRDVAPVFTQGNSFLKKDYLIATRKISTLGNLTGRSNTFSPAAIDDLRSQPFTHSVGAFTPSLFDVSAGLGMQEAGIRLSTEMFFESVPDAYIDVNLDRWHFDPQSHTIPIIIPRNYLNLYNFGFAQSRSLPKLSEGLMNLIQMDIRLSGNGLTELFKGQIVGFSNRLNTILVPQAFMEWANNRYAPGREAQPSRLIVEVDNPTDTSINDYFSRKGYETEGDSLDAGRATYFLRLVTGIVLAIGGIISLLAFFILMLSIFLLLQKNRDKLQNLLLIGYAPTQVALPYCVLTASLNLAVLLLSTGCVALLRQAYLPFLEKLVPQLEGSSLLPTLLIGGALFLVVSALNMVAIRRQLPKLLSRQARR